MERIGDAGDFYKVGLELYTRAGPDFVRELTSAGKRVFLDLKLHDIPNTVAAAVRAAADLEVDLLTVHVAGGSSMLEAAAHAAREAAGVRPVALRLLAVTVLTSLDAADLGEVWGRSVARVPSEVVRLIRQADAAGVDGAVCSPGEAADVRENVGSDFLVVTPGIRPAASEPGDQKRVATPAAAVRAGADYLVVGRAVTRASDPAAALAAIVDEVSDAAGATP
ncbi:MAG: orotidine-5'-phosphate decarboxylase [Gemmatimonadota bacterium]|nr:orotidine-5'-phosphate decarboxylase [Gemmatimonadota bacterium]